MRGHQGRTALYAALGLGRSSLSPGLGRVACLLGAEASFCATAVLLVETLGVPAATVRRITGGVGAVAEAQDQAVIGQAQAGHVPPTGTLPTGAALLVEVDGAMVHLGDDWHEVKVGLATPLGPAIEADPAPQRTRLILGAAA